MSIVFSFSVSSFIYNQIQNREQNGYPGKSLPGMVPDSFGHRLAPL
jgi:hypothetical protein